MKVIGIIAEYNPFHNGHKFQIEYAKNVLKADFIIVAMSGPFTQRGSIACYSKNTRAHAALLNGADIVFEIPVVFATSSAKEFASAGVKLLSSTNIVDTILFGSEIDDKNLFIQSAKTLISLEKDDTFQQKINLLVKNGHSYAEARSEACNNLIDKRIISSPNNILGLEYTKYILENNIPIEIECLKREGNNYLDRNLSDSYSSASSIRNAIDKGIEYKESIPSNCASLYEKDTYINENAVSELLHYKLITQTDFSSYLDCTSDISDRINNLKNNFISYTQFAELLKTKNISYTRSSRILSHILLDIKQDDFENQKSSGYVSSLRMIGFSKNGSKLLKEIKDKSQLPIHTAPSDLTSAVDIKANEIQRIIYTNASSSCIHNEFTQKFNLANI